jgi:putative sigma-54 modulation protein
VEITVSARQVEVTSALRSAVDEKIGRLSRYVEGMDHAEVHFSEERNPRIAASQVCEVTLEGHGHVVRCRAAAADPFAAVDIAEEKLEVQLRKLKTRVLQRRHKGPRPAELDAGAAVPAGPPGTEGDGSGPEPVIVKTKQHALTAMTPAEAAVQLDLVDHDFWFFNNVETGRTAVVYRRTDGDLGLIDDAG